MNIVSALLSLLLILSYWPCGEALQKRVINGINAPKDKYKWAVSLKGDLHKEESVVHCGATIIDKQWLVTAAHCFLTSEDGKVNNMTDPKMWHARAGVKKVKTEYEGNPNEEKPQNKYEKELIGEKETELPDSEWLNRYIENNKDDSLWNIESEKETQQPDSEWFNKYIEDNSDDSWNIESEYEIEQPDFQWLIEYSKRNEDDLLKEILKGDYYKKKKRSLLNDQKRDSEIQSQKMLHLHIGKIILHPKYKADDAEYDIALMKLKTPIQLKFIGKLIDVLPLPPKNVETKWPKLKQKCFLVGWGCRKKGHKGTISDIGQLAVLKVQENDFCEKIYENQAELNAEHEMCAGSYMKKMGVCAGDSGSGLVCRLNGKWALAGVTSATHGERPEDFPGLFTRVSYFTDWIRNVMNTK